MTEQEIRIGVAEELGHVIRLTDEEYANAMKEWEAEPEHPHASMTKPVRVKITTDADYPNSLDACVEFEKAMTPAELQEYGVWLTRLNDRAYGVDIGLVACSPPLFRNEAFLRVRGKWKG